MMSSGVSEQFSRFSTRKSFSDLFKTICVLLFVFLNVILSRAFAIFAGFMISPLTKIAVYSYPRGTPSIKRHPSTIIFGSKFSRGYKASPRLNTPSTYRLYCLYLGVLVRLDVWRPDMSPASKLQRQNRRMRTQFPNGCEDGWERRPVPPRKVFEPEARRRTLWCKTYSSIVATAVSARWVTVECPWA